MLEGTSQLRPVYDYVIVGGGTSGLVVANRLTENPKSMFLARHMMKGRQQLTRCFLVNVLVIEYGYVCVVHKAAVIEALRRI